MPGGIPFIRRISAIRLYRFKWVLLIATIWTLMDLLLWAIRASVPQPGAFEDPMQTRTLSYVLLRMGIVFLMSTVMGWLIVFKFRSLFRDKPLLANLSLK